MTKYALIIVGILLVLGGGTAQAAKPEIEPGILIQDGSSNLKVSGHSAPTSVDWNNDGAKDLVIGQFSNGLLKLYLNKRTNLNPVFDGSTILRSNGSYISVSFG